MTVVGPPGATGKNGLNGTDGQNGRDGKDGRDGRDGIKVRQNEYGESYFIIAWCSGIGRKKKQNHKPQ